MCTYVATLRFVHILLGPNVFFLINEGREDGSVGEEK